MPEKAEIIIIGGGIAGATAAYFLAQRGHTDLLVLEKESLPGTHSSGRNAALMRQIVPEPINCRLAVDSMQFFVDPPPAFPLPFEFRRTGSIVLTGNAKDDDFEKILANQEALGLEVHKLGKTELLKLVPALNPDALAHGAYFCPSDGVLDIHALLQGFLQGATAKGARYLAETEVESILVRGGRAAGVQTNRGEFQADWVVNAAGAWAANLAGQAGARIPLRACRRHLVVTEPLSWVHPDWPFTWDVSGGFYFRPESGGILMSPCDEEELPPCNVPADPDLVAEAAEKATRLIPRIGQAGAAYYWAGQRTLTPDHHFIVGEDDQLPGLFWVAGLGGHGMTSSPALGRVVADLLLDGKTDVIDAAALSPARF